MLRSKFSAPQGVIIISVIPDDNLRVTNSIFNKTDLGETPAWDEFLKVKARSSDFFTSVDFKTLVF